MNQSTNPAPSRDIPLTLEVIKTYICPEATEQEAYYFLQLCRAQNLNPFLREVYLIKYGSEPATIVVGKETFTKRAARLPVYDGFRAGIIVRAADKMIYREGAFMAATEVLLGGWAEVYRKDQSHSYRSEVSLAEYLRRTKDGQPTRAWREMPATLIRKVALVQALREAFPDELGGIYSPEEMPIQGSLPEYEYGQPPHPVVIEEPPVPSPSITPPQRKEAITPAQQKAIHSIADKLKIQDLSGLIYEALTHGLPEEERANIPPITSTKELTKQQASQVIEYLNAKQKEVTK